MEESHTLIPLMIVVLLAFAVPLILSQSKRLVIPVVVGEIVAGIIVGDSGLKLVGYGPILEILSLLGFAYLMFLSGLEVDFGAVLPKASVLRGTWKARLSSSLALGFSPLP